MMLFIVLVFSTLSWLVYLALTPIISRDALIVHMAFPKIWMHKSFFYFQDYNLATVSMMNLDYIYMLFLKFFHWDQLPKIFHMLMIPASGVVMFKFLKDKFNVNTAFLFSLIFITIPINQRLASETYVDLGVLFFSTISIIYFIKWIETGLKSKKSFAVLSICSGFALGTKYSSIILLVVMALMIGFVYAKEKKNDLKALSHMFAYSLIIIIVISPWLIRNYIAVGNPLFPLLNSILNPNIIQVDSNLPISPNEFASRKLLGESSLSILLIPFRMFFSGNDNNLIGGFDGVLNPMLLLLFLPLLIPWFRKRSEGNKVIKYLSAVFLLTFIFFLIHGHLRTRYFIYAIPILIILNAYSYDILSKSKIVLDPKIKKLILFCVIFLFILFNLKYSVPLYYNLDTFKYIFGDETKDQYLNRKLPEYGVAQIINENAPENYVIYQVLCGHRTYHIDRAVVYDDNFLDRYFYNMIDNEATDSIYLAHLRNLPFEDYKKADLLMIKPYVLVSNYSNIFTDQSDSLTQVKINKFNTFLNNQTLLFDSNGTYIYKVNYKK